MFICRLRINQSNLHSVNTPYFVFQYVDNLRADGGRLRKLVLCVEREENPLLLLHAGLSFPLISLNRFQIGLNIPTWKLPDFYLPSNHRPTYLFTNFITLIGALHSNKTRFITVTEIQFNASSVASLSSRILQKCLIYDPKQYISALEITVAGSWT